MNRTRVKSVSKERKCQKWRSAKLEWSNGSTSKKATALLPATRGATYLYTILPSKGKADFAPSVKVLGWNSQSSKAKRVLPPPMCVRFRTAAKR